MIALYFKFNRILSVRNLDLLGLIALAPALLMVQYGRVHANANIEHAGYIWLFAISGLFLLRLLLDTAMFDGLPAASQYVAGLVRRICSPDFMTEVGIRCRSASEGGLVDFQDYHGEWTVWMKETFEVARGVERQGLPGLARQIGIRLLNAVNIAGAHVEFLYVSPDQRVMYDFRARDLRTAEPEVINGTNQPEAPITWTVTAALALKTWLGSNRKLLAATGAPDADSWRQALEAEVLDQVPHLAVHRTSAELRRAYAGRGDFVLNIAGGVERDRRARARGRGSDSRGEIAA